VLTLSDTKEGNAALFDIYNGRLRLEDLEVRLRPRGDDTDPQAVLSFLGDGECVLKNCLITLDRAGRKTALAILPETRKPGQGPHLTLENCFVRGQGSLVCAHGGQFAELKIQKSLIALTGSLLSVESDKDLPAPADPFTLHLSKCTTYLGENLIRLRSVKDLKSVAGVKCEPEDCLFLPANDRTLSLVHLEGPENEERDLINKLSWGHGSKNAYGTFATLLEQQSLGSMVKMPSQTEREKWKDTVSNETESVYNVKLPAPPAVDAPLTQVLPSAFRVTEKGLKDYGADVAALSALPMLHGKSEASEPESDFPDPDSN
jgi:hypothetical protein